MKKFNFSSFSIVLIVGAMTAFLWLPLLPMIVPLVTVVLGLRWAMTYLLSDACFGKQHPEFKHLYFPANQVPQRQADQNSAWPSLANLPSPARADSLPSSSEGNGRREGKSFRRQLREDRHAARAMSGMDIRKQAPGY